MTVQSLKITQISGFLAISDCFRHVRTINLLAFIAVMRQILKRRHDYGNHTFIVATSFSKSSTFNICPHLNEKAGVVKFLRFEEPSPKSSVLVTD